MLPSKFIALPTKTYVDIFWMPTLLLLSSISSIIVFSSLKIWLIIKIFSILGLCFSVFWFSRIIYQLCFKTYNISVEKIQLFAVIDLLVKYEDWNYGSIQDNLITLTTATNSPVHPSHTIYIQYFEKKLLFSNTVNQPTKSIFFLQNDGLEETKKLIYLLEEHHNKSILQLSNEIQTYANQPYKIIQPLEVIKVIVSRIISHSFSLIFIGICYQMLYDIFIHFSIINFFITIVLSSFIIIGIFIHLKDDFITFKAWRKKLKNKWYD